MAVFQVTHLVIDEIPFSDAAVRDLTMTLEPIAAAIQQKRTINGELVDVSQSQFHGKYRAVISCRDQESPHFDGVLPGTIVQVTCIKDLGLGRDSDGLPQQLSLSMMVGGWGINTEEWKASVGWQLPLESV